METYQIIVDEDKLKEFIEWLPDLEDHETYYCTLFARSKYSKLVKAGDKQQIKSFTSSKPRLLNKIKQLETKVGTYLNSDNITVEDVAIPQEALAFYISINPRDFIKATRESLIEFARLVTSNYNGYNPHKKVLSHIQQSFSRKVYTEFDFDKVPYEYVKEEAEKVLSKDCLNYMITRGGVHVLVDLKKVDNSKNKFWYSQMTQIEGYDKTGTDLIPVAGCYQGGFTPILVKA